MSWQTPGEDIMGSIIVMRCPVLEPALDFLQDCLQERTIGNAPFTNIAAIAYLQKPKTLTGDAASMVSR